MKDRRPYTYVVIDFEGNLSRIKEFSYLLIRGNKIAQCKCIEYGDTKSMDEEITELSKANYDFIVSHNYTVEKNILKKYLPYVHNDGKILHWGPWIDTCRIYSSLYPQLLEYKLRFLTELFIAEKELSVHSNRLCNTQKRTFHNSTYDCICTMLIFDRVLPIIALDDFLQD